MDATENMAIPAGEDGQFLSPAERTDFGLVAGCMGYCSLAFLLLHWLLFSSVYTWAGYWMIPTWQAFLDPYTIRHAKIANQILTWPEANRHPLRFRKGTCETITVFYDSSGPSDNGAQGGRVDMRLQTPRCVYSIDQGGRYIYGIYIYIYICMCFLYMYNFICFYIRSRTGQKLPLRLVVTVKGCRIMSRPPNFSCKNGIALKWPVCAKGCDGEDALWRGCLRLPTFRIRWQKQACTPVMNSCRPKKINQTWSAARVEDEMYSSGRCLTSGKVPGGCVRNFWVSPWFLCDTKLVVYVAPDFRIVVDRFPLAVEVQNRGRVAEEEQNKTKKKSFIQCIKFRHNRKQLAAAGCKLFVVQLWTKIKPRIEASLLKCPDD